MCGKPPSLGFRTVRHSDRVCRIDLSQESSSFRRPGRPDGNQLIPVTIAGVLARPSAAPNPLFRLGSHTDPFRLCPPIRQIRAFRWFQPTGNADLGTTTMTYDKFALRDGG
jgi:hypothetical protein